jgi:uncharacterized protein YndB with AHSA1/START domain
MEAKEKNAITVQATIDSPIDNVWFIWNNPGDIVNWYFASPDWHTPRATNNLVEGGGFNFRMEAKDGSMGFDFEGIYKRVIDQKLIEYFLADDRNVNIEFTAVGNKTQVVETFDAEDINPPEIQRYGWQSILDNFKKYVENR